MHEQYRKLPLDKLLYTDTDSITFKSMGHLTLDRIKKVFPIGEEMGQFKIEKRNVSTKIYGKKTYMIGKSVKVSGIRHKWIKPEDFIKGKITSKKMITLKTANKKREIGTFRTETRDLEEQQEHYESQMMINKDQQLYIDCSVDQDLDKKQYLTLQKKRNGT